MEAIELIAGLLPPVEPPEVPTEGVCCVTGATCDTVDRKHGIMKSFTQIDVLRAPTSARIGLSSWRVLSYTVAHHDPGKKRDLSPLRQSHWVCDGLSISYLNRRELRDRVLQGVVASRWAGYATTSYKKHGALLAPVNQDGRQVWLWETRLVDCSDRAAVADTWSRLRDAQDAGIPRPLIERLDIAPGYMAKIGWRLWRDFESWARPRMRSALYEFLTYLLPSKEELKEIYGDVPCEDARRKVLVADECL